MDILETAMGKTFESDYLAVIPYPPQAYIRVCGASVTEVAAVFSDVEETARITYGQTVLTGYTRLVAIIPEGGAVKVALGKE